MWHCHPTNGSKVNRTEEEKHELWRDADNKAFSRNCLAFQCRDSFSPSLVLTSGTNDSCNVGGRKEKNAFWLIAGWAGQGTTFCACDHNKAPPNSTKGGEKRVPAEGGFMTELSPYLSSHSLHEEQPVYCQILFIFFKGCHWDNNNHTWFYYLNNTLRITGLDLQSSFWERNVLEDRGGKKANPLVHVVWSTKHQLPTVLSQPGTNVLVWLVKLILLAGFLINDTQTKNGEKLCEHILIRSKKKYH